MAEKTILDVCCGSRMFWFDKSDERVIFCDKRAERHILNYDCGDYDINVSPNVLSNFTALPFPSNHFQVVVFDPPHLNKIGKNSWTYKKYGALESEWRFMLRDGFAECFRVLAPAGTLIFKWSSVQIPISEVLKLTHEKPLFGHPSGKNGLTHWVAFTKPNKACTRPPSAEGGLWEIPLQASLFADDSSATFGGG
jgi:hypothetical protein